MLVNFNLNNRPWKRRRPGDTAYLNFQLPWPAGSALVVWGNSAGELHHSAHSLLAAGAATTTGAAAGKAASGAPTVVATAAGSGAALTGGLASVALPIGPECRRGCAAVLVISVPRAGDGWSAPAVPTSRLFDPTAPHTRTATLQLNVDASGRLDVSITATSVDDPSQSVTSAASVLPSARGAAAVTGGAGSGTAAALQAEPLTVEPGRNVTLDVHVQRNASQPQPTASATASDGGGAEITLLAVDRSILDLLPYPLPDAARQMRPALPASFGLGGTDDSRVSQAAIDAVFETILRRLRADPWLPADTQVRLLTLIT